MTVHFYYKYKEDIVKQLQYFYAKELKDLDEIRQQKAQLDEAEHQIRMYYEDLRTAIADISEVSKGEVLYEEGEDFILQLTIHKNYLKFIRTPHAIEVVIGRHRIRENDTEVLIESYIVPGDKRCVIKKKGTMHQGSHFDSGSIDAYMREIFGHKQV